MALVKSIVSSYGGIVRYLSPFQHWIEKAIKYDWIPRQTEGAASHRNTDDSRGRMGRSNASV
jgi:hypothetical protein